MSGIDRIRPKKRDKGGWTRGCIWDMEGILEQENGWYIKLQENVKSFSFNSLWNYIESDFSLHIYTSLIRISHLLLSLFWCACFPKLQLIPRKYTKAKINFISVFMGLFLRSISTNKNDWCQLFWKPWKGHFFLLDESMISVSQNRMVKSWLILFFCCISDPLCVFLLNPVQNKSWLLDDSS